MFTTTIQNDYLNLPVKTGAETIDLSIGDCSLKLVSGSGAMRWGDRSIPYEGLPAYGGWLRRSGQCSGGTHR